MTVQATSGRAIEIIKGVPLVGDLPFTDRSYTFTTHSIEVVATRTIRRGEQLTLCYVDKTLPAGARRAKLRRGYLFDCECSRCVTGFN